MARDAGQVEVAAFLEDKRLTAPAQLVYSIKGSNVNIWIGEQVHVQNVFADCGDSGC